MATKFRATDHPKALESDYGSDFTLEEESIVIQLLEQAQNSKVTAVISASSPDTHSGQPTTDALLASDLSTYPLQGDIEQKDASATDAGSSRVWQGQVAIPAGRDGGWRPADARSTTMGGLSSVPMDGIEYPDLSHALLSLVAETQPPQSQQPDEVSKKSKEGKKTPIERFRSFPKKPLTVTDISSGAWWGRKTRTTAMKGGTKVHQKLEDQVHTTVQINVSRKEEAFALRLWNFIQGLRTLRDTGLTRELEVWGSIEGQVVNGVIDELSYTSPNLGFEEELSQSQSSQGAASEYVGKQSSITEYFDPHRRRIYLTDVKTRGSTRLPSGAALRPSRVQLFIYHRLLGEMGAGKLDFSKIIARYGLQPDVRFSDAFMAQIGNLHDEVFDEVEPGEDALGLPSQNSRERQPGPSPSFRETELSPAPDLIRYRSLQQIIPLVQAELRETFPQGADTLGDLVAVVYRHREDGRIIGDHCFPTDAEALNNYLKLDLSWWLGKRNPDGVPIEEVYKCRICEFAESCEWRHEKNEEMMRKSRQRTDGGAVANREATK
ncbi:hypothetical protein PFICI_04744 [Pestalotiopsis fici W106-1]|uniref:Exonuclease V n=1 Tax=Pestalotiopsis fici (strain W106-1 / CGMCC3.15140) TaxID=1229662 RepID=W3X9T1_PESFW|nr:uncharacterized protein PFICI_04744 [Pestalotiopsis fici W106-1]ETS82868.1 hypothetical protein PFICI_04744 [Pestalotiopsis fici W106-1]